MKLLQFTTFFLALFGSYSLYAQSGATERVKESAKWKTEQRVNNTTDATIDKGLDRVEEGIKGIFKKKKKKEVGTIATTATENSTGKSSVNKPDTNGVPGAPSFQVYSKFDFIPGEKVLYYDDFTATEVGDFPTGWNTNSTAEIVTLNNLPGKWLNMTRDGFFAPEMVKDMPDNFTLEFEVVTRYRSNNILYYKFMIYKSANPRQDIGEDHLTDATFKFYWSGCGSGISYSTYENGEEMGGNSGLSSQKLLCGGDNYEIPAKAKFSLWRQKNRLRVYLNEEKVLDIPQAFNSNMKYNVFKLGAQQMNFSNGRQHDDQFFVSNFRYAVGAPDTRNKLITEGRFSTTGILFDFQKATVKAESYGVLKEIANVLKENATLNVKIVGHTSNDGDAGANLELSKQRAAAVKAVLISEFGVEAARLLTDGKGGTELVDKGNTAEAKANNRRVEFIKQ